MTEVLSTKHSKNATPINRNLQLEQTQEGQLLLLEQPEDSIETLLTHGINQQDINKLKTAGIFTLKGVLMTTRKRLATVKGFSTYFLLAYYTAIF